MANSQNSSRANLKNTLSKSNVSRARVDGINKKIKTNFQKADDKVVIEKILIQKEKVDVNPEIKNPNVDENKRLFMKVAGVAGLGLAASALFPGSAEAYVAGSTPTSNVVGSKDASNVRINPAKEDGNLASIKTNTDPLVASGAGGYIRQDSTGTIAKESGGNLATIATNIPAKGQAAMVGSTPVVIASDQTAIPVTGSFSIDAVGMKDSLDNRINPAQDDSVILLRRIVKLMESQAVVDTANRQRITIDSLGTATAITTTIPVSGTVTATVANATISTMAGQNQQMFQDVARNTYANGIRNNLTWS